MNPCYPARLAVALAMAASNLIAADKLDLSRITPVSGDQAIPIQDFFRPAILQQPALNPSGTHIAAIVTAGEDRHQLLVYDLKSQTTEFASGSGDKDVYAVNWLDDTRLMFNLGTRKMYGIGLMAANVVISDPSRRPTWSTAGPGYGLDPGRHVPHGIRRLLSRRAARPRRHS